MKIGSALTIALGYRTIAALKRSRVPILIYLVLSSASAVFLAIGGWRQVALPGEDARYTGWFPLEVLDRYFGVVSNWDGRWYRRIAEEGYPTELPRNEDGTVVQNAWAFWPLYPALVRVVMTISGLEFELSAWMTSVGCAVAACVLLYKMVLPRMGALGAGSFLACLLAYPAAPVLQAAYTESLALLLIVLFLRSVERRRYATGFPLVLAIALTRPIVLAAAVLLLVHGYQRYANHRRGLELFPTRERWKLGLLATASVASFGIWPITADLIVGESKVYLNTMAAWPSIREKGGPLGGWLGEILVLSPLGLAALGALSWTLYIVVRRGSKLWVPEIALWGLLYVLFLLAATKPGPSIIRYLMLALVLALPFPEVVSRPAKGLPTRVAAGVTLAIVGYPLWPSAFGS